MQNDYVIVFPDQSYKKINESDYNRIYTESGNPTQKGLWLTDKSYVAFSSMAKVLTLEEFNDEYPDKRFEPQLPKFLALSSFNEPRQSYKRFNPIDEATRHKNALNSLLKGFNKAIKEQEHLTSEDQQKLRDKITNKIKDATMTSDKQQFTEAFGDTPEVKKQAEEIFE